MRDTGGQFGVSHLNSRWFGARKGREGVLIAFATSVTNGALGAEHVSGLGVDDRSHAAPLDCLSLSRAY